MSLQPELSHRPVIRGFVTLMSALAAVCCLAPMSFAIEAPAVLADLERISIADTMVMVPMRDGVRLATDIYRPKDAEGKLPLPVISWSGIPSIVMPSSLCADDLRSRKRAPLKGVIVELHVPEGSRPPGRSSPVFMHENRAPPKAIPPNWASRTLML